MADSADTRFDWSWLAGTYWYVPRPDLPALQLDPEGNVLSWLVDQTVWHISGYQSGYFWGVTAALTYDAGEEPPAAGPGSRVGHLTMLGTVLPEGQIQITFFSDRKGSSPTIGFGRMVRIERLGRSRCRCQQIAGETASCTGQTWCRPAKAKPVGISFQGLTSPSPRCWKARSTQASQRSEARLRRLAAIQPRNRLPPAPHTGGPLRPWPP